MTKTPLLIILHTIIVTDLAIENFSHELYTSRPCYKSTSSRIPYKYYPRSRVIISSSYNNCFSDGINHHINLLLKHVLSVIEVNHTQIQKATLTINTNLLLISL